MVGAGLVDQLYFAGSDFLIEARAVFLDGLLGSHRAANGFALLMLLRGALERRADEGSGQTGAKSTAICVHPDPPAGHEGAKWVAPHKLSRAAAASKIARQERHVDSPRRRGGALRREHVFGELACARRHGLVVGRIKLEG